MIRDLCAPTIGFDGARLFFACDRSYDARVRLLDPEAGVVEASAHPLTEVDGEFLYSPSVTGLMGNTEYRAEVRALSNSRSRLQVRTLPRPSGEHLLRFGVLADTHCSLSRLGAPGPRLFADSLALANRYLNKLADLGADFVVLPGDVTDSGSEAEIGAVRRIIENVEIPCRLMVGNHEREPEAFLEAFGLGDGFYSFDFRNIHFVCLRTFSPLDLDPAGKQFAWLRDDLADHREDPTILFSHYALRDPSHLPQDSNRAIADQGAVRVLLSCNPQVRVAMAGHKNTPSVFREDHVTHVLCPQIVQYHAGFDVVDIYEDLIVRQIHPIDELDLQRRSYHRHKQKDRPIRFGRPEDRSFAIPLSP
jgi:calcineurin-like phosphoesterase family protein